MKGGLLPQGIRDEIYEAMVARTRARLEEEKERRKKVKEVEDEMEKDLGLDGQLHGGHKFFRAIATSLQRKSQFAAVKAVRNKNGGFDKIQSTTFDVNARAEKEVNSPKSRDGSREPSPDKPLQRYGTLKI